MKKLIASLLLLGLPAFIAAQPSERCRGITIDTQWNRPVGNCHIYLADSLLYGTSDDGGTFDFTIERDIIKPAPLTFIRAGYKPVTFELPAFEVDLLIVGMSPVEADQSGKESLSRPLHVYYGSFHEGSYRLIPEHFETDDFWYPSIQSNPTPDRRRQKRHHLLYRGGLLF